MPNPFEQAIRNYRHQADKKISSFFTEQLKQSSHNKKDLKILQEYVLRDGKRIRGYLFCLGYRFFKKDLIDLVIDFSIGHELGHAGILVQDDIFDKSELRRGEPTLHLAFGSKSDLSKFDEANRKAVLLSDLLISFGYKVFLESEISLEKRVKALAFLNKQALKTAVGEFLDLAYTGRRVVLEKDLRQMSLLKTASYTTVAPMVMGAIVAGASLEAQKKIEEMALLLGELFQMRDDFLDVFGAEDELGKAVLDDIKKGKRTYMSLLVEEVQADKVEVRRRFEEKLLKKREEILRTIKGEKYHAIGEFQGLLDFLVIREK